MDTFALSNPSRDTCCFQLLHLVLSKLGSSPCRANDQPVTAYLMITTYSPTITRSGEVVIWLAGRFFWLLETGDKQQSLPLKAA